MGMAILRTKEVNDGVVAGDRSTPKEQILQAATTRREELLFMMHHFQVYRRSNLVYFESLIGNLEDGKLAGIVGAKGCRRPHMAHTSINQRAMI